MSLKGVYWGTLEGKIHVVWGEGRKKGRSTSYIRLTVSDQSSVHQFALFRVRVLTRARSGRPDVAVGPREAPGRRAGEGALDALRTAGTQPSRSACDAPQHRLGRIRASHSARD